MSQPQTWDIYAWPEWIPAKIRQEIERFWSPPGRDPDTWMRNAVDRQAPALGSIATLETLAGRDNMDTGRYVHCWNNIGRLVHDDGTFSYVSIGHPNDQIQDYQQL
ncbi:MAG TPA: hypothetical protein VHL10_03030 [Nitrososphaera sp.]|jgi:hypothetical protein|nr:hypothetical protein [Nitrososphaera sp.]